MRRTLIDFFDDLERIDGEFLTYDDGYRTRSYTYRDVARAARAVAARLRAEGIRKGEHIAIWSENRPEWIWTMWGCLLEGVVLVPIDYRASSEFLLRVATIVTARAIITGDIVGELSAAAPVWRIGEVAAAAGGASRPVEAEPDDVAEVIFTSGATSEPKGVVLTHRNILANIIPIEGEVAKYRKYARPFLPIRFLNLLPLSHMFGQAMATFVPPMLPGTVIFTRSFAPEDIVTQIRSRRVSVLVCVPKILEVLRDYLLRAAPETQQPPPPGTHWTARWWRYRRVHKLFGFKFWAVIVGAAPLDPELEAFFGRLGFVVIQGYGLTETAPIVTLNHPFHAARGAVGKPIGGVEVRIADDGEILVRGENVTRGYFNAPEETRAAFKEGWFHTGDIGGFDSSGQLYIRGRKKEMIVTPEGLNVFPEDVERVLNALPGVRDSAVVGAPIPGSTAERVQAVLVLQGDRNVDAIVRDANAQLQDHQKIRTAAVWPDEELPRTEGTRKLKRRELRHWLMGAQSQPEAHPEKTAGMRRDVIGVLSRFAPGRMISSDTTVDELGLSSLEHVEVMMALEEALQITLDEAQFSSARTVGDLEELTKKGTLAASGADRAGAGTLTSHGRGETENVSVPLSAEPIDFPAWNRSFVARAIRRASLPTWILPLGKLFVSLDVEGIDNLRDIDVPVIFAANHQSHFDTPVILKALPPRWRYRVAPAMAKEFFKAHFHPDQYGLRARLPNSTNYYLASLFFNAFPLPQREAGTRQTLRYIGTLMSGGYSLLIFPEGKRTDAGEINPFRPGVGMIASKLGAAVVPVRVEGLDRILHQTWKFPRRGRARVAFGPPMSLSGSDYAAQAREVEEAVRRL